MDINPERIPSLIEQMRTMAARLADEDAKLVNIKDQDGDIDDLDEYREYVTDRIDAYMESMLRMAGVPPIPIQEEEEDE